MLIHSKPRIDTNPTKLDPQYMHTNRLPPKRIEFARTDSQRIDRIDSNRNNFTPPILVYQEYRLPVKRFGFTRFDSQRIDRIDSNRSNFTPPILVYQEYRLPVKRFGFTKFDSQRIHRIKSSRNNFTSPVPVRDESTEVCCHVLRTRKVLVSLFHGC